MGLYKRCEHTGKKARTNCKCPWWGQFMYRGTNVRENLTRWSGEQIDGKQGAETIYKRLCIAVANGTYRPSKHGPQITKTGTEKPQLISGTFAEVMGRYKTEHLETLRGNGHGEEADKTIARFGPMKMDDITGADLVAFVKELAVPTLFIPTHKTKKVRSRRTINRYRSLLRSMWTWAVKRKLATKNPFTELDDNGELMWDELQHDAQAEKKRRTTTLKPDQQKKLYAVLDDTSEPRRIAANERLKLVVNFAIATGLRLSEQRRATWADVDAKPGYLRVIGQDPEDGEDVNKNGLDRYVYLMPEAQRVIARLRQDLPTDSSRWSADKLLFSEVDGTAYADWRQTYWKRLTDAGVKGVTWHDLRRTYATRLMYDGVQLTIVSQQLGHQDVIVTMRYIGIDIEGLDAVLKDVAARRLASTNSTQGSGTTGNQGSGGNGGN